MIPADMPPPPIGFMKQGKHGDSSLFAFAPFQPRPLSCTARSRSASDLMFMYGVEPAARSAISASRILNLVPSWKLCSPSGHERAPSAIASDLPIGTRYGFHVNTTS